MKLMNKIRNTALLYIGLKLGESLIGRDSDINAQSAEVMMGNNYSTIDVKAGKSYDGWNLIARTMVDLPNKDEANTVVLVQPGVELTKGIYGVMPNIVSNGNGFDPRLGIFFVDKNKEGFSYVVRPTIGYKMPKGIDNKTNLELFSDFSYKQDILGIPMKGKLEMIHRLNEDAYMFQIYKTRLGADMNGWYVGAAFEHKNVNNKPNTNNVGVFLEKSL